MVLFVGLGNPGPKYQGNRHNIGFMALDAIAGRHGYAAWRKRFSGEMAEGLIDGERVTLLKPMTYMNESGQSVGEAMRWLKLEPADVYVFHDELDLAPGKIRTKLGGGAAGHNGLRSITAHIGADFRRVRMGIGHPGRKELVHRYVLDDFAKAEVQEWLEPLLDATAGAAGMLAKGDDAGFMNKVALARPAREKPAKEKPAKDKPPKGGPGTGKPSKGATTQAEATDAPRPESTPTPPRVAAAPAQAAPGIFAEVLRKLTGGRKD